MSFLGRGNARLRFLLERMQHIKGVAKAHGINGPPGVAGMRRDNLHDACAAEALERLCRRIGFAVLGGIKRLAMSRLTACGKERTSLRDAPIHLTGLGCLLSTIRLYVYLYIESRGYHS